MSPLVRFPLPLPFQLALSSFLSTCAKSMPLGHASRGIQFLSTPVPHPVVCIMMDTEAASIIIICAGYLFLKNAQKRKNKRAVWTKQLYKKRNVGLLKELQLDSGVFRNFTRMSKENFYKLLRMIEPVISKKDTKFREAVSAEMRLLITLRFLATGDSFQSLRYLFRVSNQAISEMIPEVLKALINSLKDYIKVSITNLLLCHVYYY